MSTAINEFTGKKIYTYLSGIDIQYNNTVKDPTIKILRNMDGETIHPAYIDGMMPGDKDYNIQLGAHKNEEQFGKGWINTEQAREWCIAHGVVQEECRDLLQEGNESIE